MKVYIIHKELVADGMAEINETRAFDSKEKAAKVFNEIKEKEIKEAVDADWDYDASDDSDTFFETYGEYYAANHFNLELVECEVE